MNSPVQPDPQMVARLAQITPQSHGWWDDQLARALQYGVPEEDLEALAFRSIQLGVSLIFYVETLDHLDKIFPQNG